ncbi:MAG TPA: VOC family protein [Anaeromyxobacteraceae bacterium]|jgi:uncharacterized glyoxalase superfamily protein PhnB
MARGKTRKPARRKARPAARKKKVEAVPKAYGSVTAHLVIRDCARAIEFYKKAFGAKEVGRMAAPDGKVAHAEVKFGDRIVMMADEDPGRGFPSPEAIGGTTVTLMLYVKDADRAFARAIEAGATALMPLADMFWGDRYGQVKDPFGHRWSIATHKADLTPAQMEQGMKEAMAQMAGGGPPPA